MTPNTGAASEEERYVTGIIKGMGAKDKMPGTYYLGAINSISVGPTKDGALHQEEQVMATVIVKLVVTE